MAVVAYNHLAETIPAKTLASICRETDWTEEDLIRLKLKKR
jgi:DNA-binding Xre family transcriptional regulator